MLRALPAIFSLIVIAPLFAVTPLDTSSQVIISVRDQKLMLVQNGGKVVTYPVSTSMFGVGDAWGRMTTPLGYFAVEQKIGDNAPVGAVFHNRRLTGEVLEANAPGRDPVITRIIWLRGLEAQNAHAYQRCIYIHGTPQEKTIGRPASYGCIRMKSSDITALYDRVPPGALVQIIPDRLPKLANVKVPRSEASNGVVAVSAPTQNETPNRDSLPKLPKRPPVEPTNTVVAAMALAAPPEHLTQNQPPAQDATESQDQRRPAKKGRSLTVEQMRMAGAIAAERKKPKLASGKHL